MKKILSTVMCLCTLAFITPAFADVEKAETTPAAQPAMDPAMMEKITAATTPGENHKLLASIEGDWTYTMKMWMTPDSPVEESKGTSDNEMVFNGRFLEIEVDSTIQMGDKTVPYEGKGYMGYDNVAKQFTTIWFDNMNTGIMTSKGTYDAATKTINETGEASCPMRGHAIKHRSELKFIDANSYSLTMYMMDDAGKEFKSMEILYTREK